MSDYYMYLAMDEEFDRGVEIARLMEEDDERVYEMLVEALDSDEYCPDEYTGMIKSILRWGPNFTRKQKKALCVHYVLNCQY